MSQLDDGCLKMRVITFAKATELMAEAFVFNMDSVGTKDYLDARLGEHEANLEAKFDARITRLESKINLHSWMLAILAASTVIPAITRFRGY
mgnify:CR=1 FL=1